MSRIELISFDLDDTLWSTKRLMLNAEQHAFQLLCERAPIIAEHYDLMTLFHARLAQWKTLIAVQPNLKYRVSELRKQSLAAVLQSHNYNKLEATQLSEDIFEHFMHWRHQPVYFDHAIDTLKLLSEQYPMAAITNGNACTRRLGLDKYFALHVSAEELGIGKPEAKPFEHTLQHFNVPAQNCLHIGDNPQDDILGAQALGIRTLWFNKKQEAWPEDQQKADWETDCLSKIPAAVEQLQDR